MNRIGLVGAMPVEVAPILKCLKDGNEEWVGPLKFYTGNIDGVPVVVHCCGVSKVNAAMGTQAMIQNYHPQLIIHMGVGGALSKELKIGDVVVATGCVQYDVDTSALGDPVGMVSTVNRIVFDCDEAASNAVRDAVASMEGRGFSVYSGIIATGDRFLVRGQDKQWIAETFGALTCDQESCAVAQVCCVHGTPVCVIRAVSDASDDKHAEEFGSFVNLAASNAASAALEFLVKSGRNFV